MFCVYLNQIINKSLFTTNAVVVLWCDQKYYCSDPVCKKFDEVHLNHSSCAPGSTRDVCFGSWVSPIISVPGTSFSVLGLGS